MTTEPTGPLSRLAVGLGRDSLTDGQLLARFLDARDETAFAHLVRRHGPMVLGVGRRVLGNPADADDAFQATFLVLARKARTLTTRATIGDWLYGVAYTTALKARAAAMRRRAKETAAARGEGVTDPDGPDDWAAALDRELARLPGKYREPVVLCELEDRPRREVAARLGIPEGTLSSRLATAKRMLADRLGRRGIGLPAGGVTALVAQSAADGSVSPILVAAAVKAAVGGSAGAVPAAVSQLADEVIRAMIFTKWKIGGVAVTALVAAGTVAVAGSGIERGPASGPKLPVAASRLRPVPVQAPVPSPDKRPAEDALREASKVLDSAADMESIYRRINLWCSIADLRRSLGDSTGAAEALEKAKGVANFSGVFSYGGQWRPVFSFHMWVPIGKAYSRAGDVKMVAGLASFVEERAKFQNRPDSRIEMLVLAAAAAVDAGDLKTAEAIVESFGSDQQAEAVKKNIRRGMLMYRAKTAKLQDAYQAIDTLSATFKVEALVGRDYDYLHNPSGEAEVTQKSTFSACFTAGNLSDAKEVALKALALLPEVPERSRSVSAAALVLALAKLDDVANARKAHAIVRATPAPPGKAKDPPAARSNLDANASAYLAAAEARAGHDEAAKALADEFTDPLQQAHVLEFIGYAQYFAGRKDSAKATFARAAELLEKSSKPGSGWMNLIAAQAACGDTAGAIRLAERLGSSSGASPTAAANYLEEAGALDASRRLAIEHQSELSPQFCEMLLRQIATKQAKAGQAAAVREWADKVTDPLAKAYALTGLAEGLFRENVKTPAK